mgnify:FL=1
MTNVGYSSFFLGFSTNEKADELGKLTTGAAGSTATTGTV